MKVYYSFFPKISLFIIKSNGIFNIDAFLKLETYILNITNNLEGYQKIIMDLRGMNLGSFIKHYEKVKKNSGNYQNIKTIWILDDPANIANLHLYNMKVNYKNLYCSTLDYAVSFHDLESMHDEIRDAVDNPAAKMTEWNS